MSRSESMPVIISFVNFRAADSGELIYNLQVEGYYVLFRTYKDNPIQSESGLTPHVVIINQNKPEPGGFAAVKDIRAICTETAIIVLSDPCKETDKLRAFRLGADDYIEKPVRVLELIARIDALIRRIHQITTTIIRFGDIEINLAARTVYKNNREISLTPLEFELLKALIKKNGSVAPRLELLKTVWGHTSKVTTRTIDTHIFELRKKLENRHSERKIILTVPKVGYRIPLIPPVQKSCKLKNISF